MSNYKAINRIITIPLANKPIVSERIVTRFSEIWIL